MLKKIKWVAVIFLTISGLSNIFTGNQSEGFLAILLALFFIVQLLNGGG